MSVTFFFFLVNWMSVTCIGFVLHTDIFLEPCRPRAVETNTPKIKNALTKYKTYVQPGY